MGLGFQLETGFGGSPRLGFTPMCPLLFCFYFVLKLYINWRGAGISTRDGVLGGHLD